MEKDILNIVNQYITLKNISFVGFSGILFEILLGLAPNNVISYTSRILLIIEKVSYRIYVLSKKGNEFIYKSNTTKFNEFMQELNKKVEELSEKQKELENKLTNSSDTK